MKEEYAKWRAVMKDTGGRYRITSLFWEKRGIGEREEKYEPLFTTKDNPHTVPTVDKKGMVTYPSLRQIYMSYDHVPGHEYEFALDVFGSWDHWVALCKSTLKGMFQEWRDELAIKMKAEAIRNVIQASRDSSSAGLNAAKYLADEGYKPKRPGRVTKEEKEREIKMAAGVRDNLAEDMERLGLSVVNGAK